MPCMKAAQGKDKDQICHTLDDSKHMVGATPASAESAVDHNQTTFQMKWKKIAPEDQISLVGADDSSHFEHSKLKQPASMVSIMGCCTTTTTQDTCGLQRDISVVSSQSTAHSTLNTAKHPDMVMNQDWKRQGIKEESKPVLQFLLLTSPHAVPLCTLGVPPFCG